MTDLWGKIDMATWENLPCVVGRPATENDVQEGRAVFFVPSGSKAGDLALPFCALQILEDDKFIPVVAIQAEETDDQVIIGIRYLEGGNGVCTLSELVVLDAPNELF